MILNQLNLKILLKENEEIKNDIQLNENFNNDIKKDIKFLLKEKEEIKNNIKVLLKTVKR